jgi:hypothetical protein
MKASVINNFIDNKIRTWIFEKKEFLEIISSLNGKIFQTNNMRSRFKDHIAKFSQKRIHDLVFIKSNKKFKHLSQNQMFTLVRLRDKLQGFQDFDI